MNQTPNPNKKPAAPAPKWNPYYRRNPDGTPGGHDKTLKQNAERAEASRRPALAKPAPGPTPGQPSQGTPGQPVRRPRPTGRGEPVGERRPQAPKGAPAGGTRYRRQENGTLSRVYPHKGSRGNARRNRLLLMAVAALIVLVALIIGVVAIVKGISPKVTYIYDYDGQFTAKIDGAEARPDDAPYLNMNYLAAIYSMTVSGSYEDMKFSTADGEYASFVPGSRVTMVNGNRHVMSEPAILRGQEMWIPSDFVESVFAGITVIWDNEKHTVTVTPAKDESGKKTAPLTFKLRPVGTSSSENWDAGYHYLTDMTAFRDAIEPADRDAYLILVNKEHALPDSYVPAGLVDVTNMKAGYAESNRQKMCEVAERALQALYQDMTAAGFTDVGVTSGYRTYKVQELLFQKYVYEEMDKNGLSRSKAEEAANRYSARPGQSEHQSGLAVDMYNTASASEEFAATQAYAWLEENAHQYGFIIRYPADKTTLTGYDFEPWHFRFVGRYHATKMHEEGLCLEEYLAKLG